MKDTMEILKFSNQRQTIFENKLKNVSRIKIIHTQ